jgi:pimeloyl-ACP methyl ester carboxylesterase
MTTYNHYTAPTQFVEANGIRFAYRRFGKTGSLPIVMNIHFRGTMDHWDPVVTDGLAERREVILFDNAGVGASSGEVPATFPDMARDAIAFIKALGIGKADVLGYSIGGKIAQEIAVQAPDLVRKLVLVGTGPRGADTAASKSAEIFSATSIRPNIFGSPRISRPLQPAGRLVSGISNASTAAGTAARRSARYPPQPSTKRSSSRTRRSMVFSTIWPKFVIRRWSCMATTT